MLKRRAARDVAIGLTLAIGTSYAWWTLVRMPQVENRKAYYRALEASKSQA